MVGGGGGDLQVEVNGVPQKLGAPRKIFLDEWQAYNIDPAALKPGVNDIVIRGTGMVWIARADDSYVELPHRSARSADGGKSWSVDGLGAGRRHRRRVLRTGASGALCPEWLPTAAGNGCSQPRGKSARAASHRARSATDLGFDAPR